jgi:PAS domain S-box-containing protein
MKNKNIPLELTSGVEYEDKNKSSDIGQTDFAEIERLKKELVDIRTKFNLMIDNVSEIIFQIDHQGILEFLNPAWSEITGFSVAESIGNKITDYLFSEDYRNYETFLEFIDNEEKFIELVIRLKTKSGSFRWIEVNAKKKRSRKGDSVIDGRLNDITIRKLVEDELKTKRNQLLEMNQTLEKLVKEEVAKNREKDVMLIKQSRQAAMGEMIGNIAHQWRQPLNALGLMIENCYESFKCGEMTPEYLEKRVGRMKELIQHMSQTIEDFRNFFRPDKEKQEFSLKEVVEKTLSFVKASFNNNNIELIFEAERDIRVRGFPNEYAQVLLNILNNAKDVLLEREIQKPCVRIGLTCDGAASVVTVTDNAGGIPEDIIDKVFEPYFTTKDQGKGTGIGLYMSKTIIEKNMNGRLTARNVAEGAEFRIEV